MYSIGFGWVLPAIVAFVVSNIFVKRDSDAEGESA
jgi:hypothetical protein